MFSLSLSLSLSNKQFLSLSLSLRLSNKQSPSSCPWTYVFSHPPLLTDIAREMRPIVPFLVGEHKHSLFHRILGNFPDTDVGLKEM